MTATPDAPGPRNDAIVRATWLVSALTLLSRFLGLARDYALIAIFGGAPLVTDAFVFAFTLPNLFRRLFGEGALAASFIPVFVNALETDRDRASRLASTALGLLALTTGGIAAIGVAVCLGGLAFVEPGGNIALTLKLAAIMLPFTCLVCCSALLSGMLQSARSFALPAAMSIILNLCFLAAFAWVHYSASDQPREETIFVVAWAVVASGLIQLLLQIPPLALHRIRLRPNLDLQQPEVMQVLKNLGPTALGLGVVQINVLIDNLIAYGLSLSGAEGATTYLYLGNRLMQLPLGVFAIAVATTVFPYLSSHAGRGELKEMLQQIKHAIRLLVFIMAPAAVGLAVLAAPVIQLIFQKPDLSFSDAAVYRTSAVLACYAAGLVFFGLQHLFTRAFYAMKDTRTPVRVAMWMVGVNLALNLLLIHAPDLFRRWQGEAFYAKWQLTQDALGGVSLGEAGLALATSITALLNVTILWSLLKRKLAATLGEENLESELAGTGWALGRILIAAVLTGGVAYFAMNSIPYEPEFLARLERGIAPILVAIGAYVILCMVIPVPEFEEFTLRWRKAKGATTPPPGKTGTA